MCGRMLQFALPGDGEIVLTLEGSRLLGQFHGTASILPAREGTIELVRE